MKHQELIDRITKIAEDLDWKVDVSEDTRWNPQTKQSEIVSDILEITFSRYSKAGQDFSFSANMEDGDVDGFIDEVSDFYEGFDPDYEATLWIGEDGHGMRGAPYHITDIVKDMKDCELMVEELLDALMEANREGEFEMD